MLDERLEEVAGPLDTAQRAAGPPRRAADRGATQLQRASVVGRVFWDDAVESLRSTATDAADDRRRVADGGARPAARPRGRVPAREVGVRRRPRVPVQARPAARRRLRRGAAPPSPALPPPGRPLVRADGRGARRADEYAGADRRPSREQRRPRAAGALVPRRRPAGCLGPRTRGRPPAARPRASSSSPNRQHLLRFDLLLARESVLDRIGDRTAQQADLYVLDSLEASVAKTTRNGASDCC